MRFEVERQLVAYTSSDECNWADLLTVDGHWRNAVDTWARARRHYLHGLRTWDTGDLVTLRAEADRNGVWACVIAARPRAEQAARRYLGRHRSWRSAAHDELFDHAIDVEFLFGVVRNFDPRRSVFEAHLAVKVRQRIDSRLRRDAGRGRLARRAFGLESVTLHVPPEWVVQERLGRLLASPYELRDPADRVIDRQLWEEARRVLGDDEFRSLIAYDERKHDGTGPIDAVDRTRAKRARDRVRKHIESSWEE